MAQLNVRRNYAANTPLLKQDLDAFIDDIETFINVTQLNDDNFQDASITASTKIVAGTYNGSKFINGAFTTAKITDANITTAKLADGAITTAKILDDNVTTAKLADSAISAGKIADGIITFDKMVEGYTTASRGTQVSTPSTPSTKYTKLVDMNLTTLTGDSYIMIEGISGVTIASDSDTEDFAGDLRVLEANYMIARKPQGGTTSTIMGFVSYSLVGLLGPVSTTMRGSLPPNGLKCILPSPGAGTYTYSVYVSTGSLQVSSSSIVFSVRKLSK